MWNLFKFLVDWYEGQGCLQESSQQHVDDQDNAEANFIPNKTWKAGSLRDWDNNFNLPVDFCRPLTVISIATMAEFLYLPKAGLLGTTEGICPRSN